LERQLKRFKSASAEAQTDQAATARAVKAAVERQRAAWRRKLEQGRARFRQIVSAEGSAEQSLGKVKALLEETEPISSRGFIGEKRCVFNRKDEKGVVGQFGSYPPVIPARLPCLAREESRNPGPFARQPRARVTQQKLKLTHYRKGQRDII